MSPNLSTAPASASPAISIGGVSKRFGRVLALDGISLDIRQGELFALLGPNGAGKSTLMMIVSGLLKPDAGSVHLAGIDVLRNSRQARKRLGMVFQEPSLDTRLTVAENLDFHAHVFQVPRALRKRRMEELLEIVELSDVGNRIVRTLSVGMRRRVEIARSLMHDSKVVILDEPTVGLDAQSRARIWEYLDRLRKERDVTLVVTTHYIDEVESCDRLAIIDRGKLLALDTPQNLRAAHGAQLLRVRAKDAATLADLKLRFPDAAATGELDLSIRSNSDADADVLFAEFGPRLKSIVLEQSSLESVYLGFTGRAMRDAGGGAGGAEGRRPGEEPRL